MKIFVNGDSHSYGTDAGGPEFSYARHIGNHYNTVDVINRAHPGVSNQRIITSTLRYLQEDTPDLVIIGWSTWEREEWYWNGTRYNITASGVDTVPGELKNLYKEWVIHSCRPEIQHLVEEKNHNLIWQLHNILLSRNIKHLFFNCYSYYHYIKYHNKLRFDWGNNYIDPYEKSSTYYFWLEDQGFKPANSNFYHYGPDAHRAWAEFLIPYIDQL